MRTEVKRLQRELNLTTIYVTHDQSEALALSHEIAVMNDGFIKQIGTPRQIYETPNSQFVADFVGTTNFIGGTVTSVEGGGTCVVSSGMGEIKAHAADGVVKNNTVIVSIRPEDVELSEQEPPANTGDNVIRATVHTKDFLGEYLDFHVRVGDVVLQARAHPSLRTPTGDPIFVRMKADKCIAIASDMPSKTADKTTASAPASAH
jgi:iron(III) transport system ATP-binding protein